MMNFGGAAHDMISRPISSCRLCGSAALDPILDLGAQPPANSLRTDRDDILEAVPLAICRCPNCTVVQLTETVAPEHLFRDYVWVTGTSQTARKYSHTFFENVTQRAAGGPLFVVEIASNDGTFLQRFCEHGHRVLGVDPAQNLARAAEAAGIPTVAEFFGLETAKQVTSRHGLADVVIARNVLPHVPDPNGLVSGIAECLGTDGLGAIEFHWIDKILAELHYDSIYHEHFFYHSLHSVGRLLVRHSLTLFDVAESPISGGSLVAYFAKAPRPATDALETKLEWEQKRGLASLAVWRDFASRSIEHRRELRSMVESELSAGRRLIGYGASARSSTLLNFCGIDRTHLICIADQSPLKQGRFTPGTDIPIVSPESALSEKPDTILVLAWNFRDEILGRLADLGFAGDVIVPLPGRPQRMRISQ
jgi:SAM-dependent methyltransferase